MEKGRRAGLSGDRRQRRRHQSISSTTATAPASPPSTAILRATNILLAGRTVVVAGYGMCGRGVATRAKGMGAHVIVTEVEPMRALEAVMDGFQVMPMAQAAEEGDVFVTVTATCRSFEASTSPHEGRRDPGELRPLQRRDRPRHAGQAAQSRRVVRPFVEEFALRSAGASTCWRGPADQPGRGRGHPAAVMDMSFANQALSAEFMVKKGRTLDRKVYVVPREIDLEIARLSSPRWGWPSTC